MAIVIITMVLDDLIPAVLVGVALFAVAQRSGWSLSSRKLPLILLCIFAFLGTYYLPALLVLDATITVHNSAVAQTFHLSPDFPILELFGFGWYAFVVWLVQTWVAILVATLLARRRVKPG